jgi:hypothetical protein
LLTTTIFKNLELTIASIVAILAFRSVIAELNLSKILGVSLSKDIILEIMLTIIFILSSWFVNGLAATFIYSTFYIIYLFIKKKDLKRTMINIRALTM